MLLILVQSRSLLNHHQGIRGSKVILVNETSYDQDGNEHYATIFDKIYNYTVRQSKSDNDVLKLYKLVTQNYPNLQKVEHLHKTLEQQRVRGWVMTRAKSLLNPE